jgi:membrane carboxypeptidase/penicillin-binding protein
MKRALEYYPDAKPFARPDGITSAEICPESGGLASQLCPSKVAEIFIAGSEPQNSCAMHSGSISDPAQLAGWDGSAAVAPTPLPQN